MFACLRAGCTLGGVKAERDDADKAESGADEADEDDLDAFLEKLPSVPPEPQRPQISAIGRYRLCFELASGGMAAVFLARTSGPSDFEKLVALKTIHPHLAKDQSYVDMFLDEARIAAQIDHANVCNVFDFGEMDGTYFIAMEYLLGESLSRVIKDYRKCDEAGEFNWPAIAARIIADACEGLHCAHERTGPGGTPLDIVHRDISPQNLFVTYDGVVKVVDFGIASAQNRIHSTATGDLKGKVAYMAPEQITDTVDRRADVWALGVVLWEMLTRRRLFRRENQIATAEAVLRGPIPAPYSISSDIPPALDSIVLKALERDRDRRYATAREFGEDLLRATASMGDPIGLGDISRFMKTVLAGQYHRKLQLVELARMAERDVPKIYSPSQGEDSSLSMTRGDGIAARVSAQEPKRRNLTVPLLVAAVVGLGGWVAWDATTGPEAGATPAAMAEGPTTAAVAAEPEVSPTPARAAEEEAEEEDAPLADAGVAEAPSEAMEPAEATASSPPRRRGPRRGRRRPAAPSTEAAAPEEAPGRVNVVTPGGWAEVYDVSGRRLGTTPVTVSLPAGRRTLVLRPFGQPERRRESVTVRSGERVPLVVRLASP